jgi:hypothetical protein
MRGLMSTVCMLRMDSSGYVCQHIKYFVPVQYSMCVTNSYQIQKQQHRRPGTHQ